MLGLLPMHAQDAARCQLIDIRPARERLFGLGFIAGSLGLPQSDDLEIDAESIDRIAGVKLPVLLCLDGQRSRGMVLALARTIGLPLGYLERGLLGWKAAGLPVAGCSTNVGELMPMEYTEYRHMVHVKLEALLAHTPTLKTQTSFILERCAMGLGRPMEHWALYELQRLPDLLAVILLDLEIPRVDVSLLVDLMMARMPTAEPVGRAAS